MGVRRVNDKNSCYKIISIPLITDYSRHWVDRGQKLQLFLRKSRTKRQISGAPRFYFLYDDKNIVNSSVRSSAVNYAYFWPIVSLSSCRNPPPDYVCQSY